MLVYIFPAPFGVWFISVYIGVYIPGVYWCKFSRLLLVFGVYGIVASNCAPIKSWMNDGGEVSFDRIVGKMFFILHFFSKEEHNVSHRC